MSLWRRDGRRFVHANVRVDDVRDLPRLAPFAWSAYRFERRGDMFEFRQVVGPSAGSKGPEIQWTGEETVLSRMHLPSEILFHNAPSREVERGNILKWEQPLAERLAGQPVEIEVDLESESILYTTLLLFGSTVVAAARGARTGHLVDRPPRAGGRYGGTPCAGARKRLASGCQLAGDFLRVSDGTRRRAPPARLTAARGRFPLRRLFSGCS